MDLSATTLTEIEAKIKQAEEELAAAKKEYANFNQLLKTENLTPEKEAVYLRERGAAEKQQELALESRNALLLHYDQTKANITQQKPRTLSKLDSSEEGLYGFVVAETTSDEKRFRLDSDAARQDRVVKLAKELWGEADRISTIWLRPCYTDVAKIVHAKFRCTNGSILVAGSRGIGKSVFGLLMVRELVDDGKVVLYEHKGARMVIVGSIINPDQRAALDLCFEKRGYSPIKDQGVYQFLPADEGLWLLMITKSALTHVQDLGDDKKAAITRIGNGRKLILTSPNHEQLSQLHSDGRLMMVFMPLWELWELQHAREACYPDITEEYVEEAFAEYGGIVRFVLDFSKGVTDTKISHALNKLNFETVERLFRTTDFENLPSQTSTGYFVHIVPKMYTAQIAPRESLGKAELDDLWRKYGAFGCQFASQDMERMLAEKFIEDQTFQMEKFASAVQGIPEFKSLYGYMLEAHGHLTLPKGGEKRIRLLNESGQGPPISWTMPALDTSQPRYTKLDASNDVSVRPNQYWRPKRKNEPTLDSFMVVDKSPFNPTGLALVLNQFASGTEHKVDGAVVKSVQERVLQKIPPEYFPVSSKHLPRAQRKATTTTAPKPTIDDLPTVLLFCTTASGIAKSQKILNGDGNEYKRQGDMPNIRQYAMVMDSRYEQLVKNYRIFE